MPTNKSQVSKCFLNLNQGKVAIVDCEDFPRVIKHIWHFGGRYVRGMVGKKGISLHRFILGYKGKKVIDHINGNTLDNRKENLRICTHSRNIINSKKRTDNSSGVVGVYWDKVNVRWVAKITIGKVSKSLGSSKDKNKMIALRKKYEKKYYKQFNPRNNE